MRGRMKQKRRQWKVHFGTKFTFVEARTRGAAVAKAARLCHIQPKWDRANGEWKNVSAELA